MKHDLNWHQVSGKSRTWTLNCCLNTDAFDYTQVAFISEKVTLIYYRRALHYCFLLRNWDVVCTHAYEANHHSCSVCIQILHYCDARKCIIADLSTNTIKLIIARVWHLTSALQTAGDRTEARQLYKMWTACLDCTPARCWQQHS